MRSRYFRVYKHRLTILLIIVMFSTFTACNTNKSSEREESSDENVTLETVSSQEVNNNSADENSNIDNVELEKEDAESFDVDEYADYDESTRGLIESAKGGDLDSMNTLAYYYFNGIDVEQDYQKSLEWSTKSAKGGNLASMFNVGYNYYYGFAGEVNYNLAFEWYERAADEMFPKALNALGHMYYQGVGVEKDVEKALEYTLQSAGFLHGYSLSNMGAIIEDESLDGDANYWYRLAAKNYMIQSGSTTVLYDNLIKNDVEIEIDYPIESKDIPEELIQEVLFKFYSGTLYDYLEESSQVFKNFELDDYNIVEVTDRSIKPVWWYDTVYLVDINNDGIKEILSYVMEGTGGGISFNILENVDEVYRLTREFQRYPMEVGINGLITFEDEKYFIIANVDIGNRIIYGVSIYSFDGLMESDTVEICIDEIGVKTLNTYQAGIEYNDLAEIVENRINKMFVKKYSSLLYDNVNESMVLDSDIDNNGDIEHYEFESIFWGTINRPISLEFNREETEEEDIKLIEEVIRFNDLGIPLGLEIFTSVGTNYVSVLYYELGTNNHCLTTFKLEKDEMTVIMNHLITFNEKFIVN